MAFSAPAPGTVDPVRPLFADGLRPTPYTKVMLSLADIVRRVDEWFASEESS